MIIVTAVVLVHGMKAHRYRETCLQLCGSAEQHWETDALPDQGFDHPLLKRLHSFVRAIYPHLLQSLAV